MVSSMRGNASDGDVVDGKHVTSKVGYVGHNGGITRGESLGGGVEYSGGMKVSRVVWNTLVV